ncbi:peroxiredoxin [Candidatus Woesearchaeota archaeon CG10_big_fil_rev_8_21_14_0_10_45_16]|nr:MAG: peroxiredoxin [Candidatus Woesearchaeota archaeon CG10_big_fil_rev_8_21_14_0_10_45_16]
MPKAKSFTLPDQNGQDVSLSDFKGRWVVLYFYPKDNTSGCTLEAHDFTAAKAEFGKLGVEIAGVSPDSVKSHAGFCEKEGLGITLLSDESKKVLEAYGVWQEKSMYGRKYLGVVRSTFLIDPAGNVAYSWSKVSVPGHVKEVLQKIKELK